MSQTYIIMSSLFGSNKLSFRFHKFSNVTAVKNHHHHTKLVEGRVRGNYVDFLVSENREFLHSILIKLLAFLNFFFANFILLLLCDSVGAKSIFEFLS